MTLNLRHQTRYPWIFAGGCIALIPLVFLLPPDSRFIAAITALGCLGGFVHFLYSQHHQDTRLFRELFKDFNERYDKLNNDLNEIRMRIEDAKREGKDTKLKETDKVKLEDEEKLKLYDYFNLCAEEHFFHEAGYIDHQVWRAWCRGMVIFDDVSEIHTLWEKELRTGSYYGFSLDKIRAA